jgi:hypothetical protein
MGSADYLQYQPAQLQKEGDLWRIVWYNYNPATECLERVRKTFALNRIRNAQERRRVAGRRIKMINQALADGWNYFVNVEGQKLPEILQPVTAMQPAAQPVVTVLDALDAALTIRKVGMKPRTASSYGSFVTRLGEWLTENKLASIAVTDFTPQIFQQYIISKSEAGHGNRNINDHTNFFKTTFEVIRKKLKLIQVNPVEEFDYLPEQESKKFAPITAEELQIIVPALLAYNVRYYLYCKFIPDEYIRPWHIARLKARDINYGTNEIYTGGDTAKNNRNSAKQLMADLKKMLIDMNYHKIPGNHYLFSKNFEPGPVLDARLSITAAEIWKEIVIDGLGIQKQMYALKHTSAQYFVNNNAHVDVYYLRQQLEHSSARETEIYLQKNVKKRVKDGDINTLKF